MATLGEIVDGLGAHITLDDGDLVASVVVLSKIIAPDGLVRLAMATNEGLDWIDQTGMVSVAKAILDGDPLERTGDA